MVVISNGATIPRDRVVFSPVIDDQDKQKVYTHDRAYKVDENGTFRRIGYKPTKQIRRQMKRARADGRVKCTT